MKQEQLTEAWNLLASKAVVWGWDSRSYGPMQTLIKDGRFIWSRKAPADREPGAWQELQMTPEELARAMQVLRSTYLARSQ
jgi:hypothetical protein